MVVMLYWMKGKTEQVRSDFPAEATTMDFSGMDYAANAAEHDKHFFDT